MKDEDVLLEFLRMPLESSEPVFQKFAGLQGAIVRGDGLEKFLFLQGMRENRVLLVAHADTFWDETYHRPESSPKAVVQQDGIIKNSHGGLGADDRAGCALLWLLKDTGHSLLIANGQEDGCKGSRWLMEHHGDIAAEINRNHQFAVQFDRRNGTDYKCYSVGTDAFREYIELVTGYSEPDRRFETDIVFLCRNICGVNLSVGFHREHSKEEYLILEEWQRSLDLCRRWLSTPNLPRFSLHENSPPIS